MIIKIDDLSDGKVIALLEEHLADMYATSPSESVHALDVDGMKRSDITFFSGWTGNKLQGCLAIKELSSEHVELKSMRTATNARKSGVASQLLTYALNIAKNDGYQRVSLETGTQEFFKPARCLYQKFGFEYCEPFSNYSEDPHSCFMTKLLSNCSPSPLN